VTIWILTIPSFWILFSISSFAALRFSCIRSFYSICASSSRWSCSCSKILLAFSNKSGSISSSSSTASAPAAFQNPPFPSPLRLLLRFALFEPLRLHLSSHRLRWTRYLVYVIVFLKSLTETLLLRKIARRDLQNTSRRRISRLNGVHPLFSSRNSIKVFCLLYYERHNDLLRVRPVIRELERMFGISVKLRARDHFLELFKAEHARRARSQCVNKSCHPVLACETANGTTFLQSALFALECH